MESTQRRLAVIMFADIVGYTALMQRDEREALLARKRHREAIERASRDFDGEIVQFYGDGALLLFTSALMAVEAAAGIQGLLRQEPVVQVRIGMHLGDVIVDQGSVYGDCVNLASRIESVAVPGSVMLSDKVAKELANQPAVKLTSFGQFEFKNVGRPIEVYALNKEGLVVPHPGEVRSEKAKKRNQSIAIFPFVERGGANEDYFTEGVTEEIVSGLTKVEGLSVMSETTTQVLMGSDNMLEEGRKAGISQFLEGNVRRSGDRVRVSVRLTNTNDGFQIWSETYDRNLDDIFEVQDEIAKHVINALKVNFKIGDKGESVLQKPTENIQAYTQYLKGMHHWKRRDPESTKRAIDFFNRALELDPKYASARCALSSCYAFLGSCGVMTPTDAYARALQYAMTAVESNPDSAEGQLAMGNIKFYHFWDWEGARESLEKAESKGLKSAALYQAYGLYYAAVGKPAEGVVKMRKALELDPLSVPVLGSLAILLLFNEQYDEAIETFDEVLELEPSFRSARQYKGVTFMCRNQLEPAVTNLREYHAQVPDPTKGITALAIALYRAGYLDEAQQIIDRINAKLAIEASAGDEIDLALIYAGIGRYDECVDLMERVYEKRLSVACMGIIWIMRCPCFKEFWSHPRYIKLAERMGVPAMSESQVV